MQALSALIGTAIGALITGVFWIVRESQQRRHEKEKYRRNLLLDKYETIFQEIEAYLSLVSEISFKMIADVEGASKFDASSFSATLKDTRLSMNITFYAPELIEDLKNISAQQEAASISLTNFILNSGDDLKERKKLVRDAVLATKKLSGYVEQAKEKLAKMANSLTAI